MPACRNALLIEALAKLGEVEKTLAEAVQDVRTAVHLIRYQSSDAEIQGGNEAMATE
ncbi:MULTISPECIES: hypothetical protein [unclassified Aureimonas]|uniref:hypothetical protein n=1 Tax=unclassified Aureimonas TaxID=2615206 RepID=UPI00071FCCB8|nr:MULTISPECIES: hypothetical protein [unclassified Aureimonas]ALN75645.1 hypothetical protein M673_23165 [Aureimonas sp. AU20]